MNYIYDQDFIKSLETELRNGKEITLLGCETPSFFKKEVNKYCNLKVEFRANIIIHKGKKRKIGFVFKIVR